jgi:hypothetical protein
VLAQPVELGLGAREALSIPGSGRVVGVFSRAAYLKLPGGLMALTAPDVPSGPVHARSAIAPHGLRIDERVVVTDSLFQAGEMLLDLRHARVWTGPLPIWARLEAAGDQAVQLLEAASNSSKAEETAALHESLTMGDLEEVARLLGGRGPGLTPAGDDCLAGILLIARVRWGESAEPWLTGIAAGVETNDVSRMFLRWAARGQSIEPVHDLLISAASGELGRAARALERLTSFGHTSGADLARGLRLGLRWLRGSCLTAASARSPEPGVRAVS